MDAAKAWNADAAYLPFRDLRVKEQTPGASLSFLPTLEPHQRFTEPASR
jgi:hypothetical protein